MYDKLKSGIHDFKVLHGEIVQLGYKSSYYNFHKQLTLRIHTNSLSNNFQIARKDFIKLLYKEDIKRLRLDEHNERLLNEFLLTDDKSAQIIRVMNEFRCALSHEKIKPLNEWLKKYSETQFGNLAQYITQIKKDIKAIKYQIKCRYTNGPTEGLVGKLKAIKRRTYGRCNFETLRSLIFLCQSPQYE